MNQNVRSYDRFEVLVRFEDADTLTLYVSRKPLFASVDAARGDHAIERIRPFERYRIGQTALIRTKLRQALILERYWNRETTHHRRSLWYVVVFLQSSCQLRPSGCSLNSTVVDPLSWVPTYPHFELPGKLVTNARSVRPAISPYLKILEKKDPMTVSRSRKPDFISSKSGAVVLGGGGGLCENFH